MDTLLLTLKACKKETVTSFFKDQGRFTRKLTSFNIDSVEEMEGLTGVELDPLYSAAV